MAFSISALPCPGKAHHSGCFRRLSMRHSRSTGLRDSRSASRTITHQPTCRRRAAGRQTDGRRCNIFFSSTFFWAERDGDDSCKGAVILAYHPVYQRLRQRSAPASCSARFGPSFLLKKVLRFLRRSYNFPDSSLFLLDLAVWRLESMIPLEEEVDSLI